MPDAIPAAPISAPKESVLDWLGRNPRVGLAGIVASILGVPLAIVLFVMADKHREIVYTTSSSPTLIVKSGQSSELHVLYKGQEMNTDVSSIKVAIWNAGKESIRRENILSTVLTVSLRPRATILEARVAPGSRPLTGFYCAKTDAETVLCSWDILEGKDGGVLELIYKGTSKEVLVSGDIEGRRAVKFISYGPSHDKFSLITDSGLILSGLSFGIAIFDAFALRRHRINQSRSWVVIMVLLVIAVVLTFTWLQPVSPFPL